MDASELPGTSESGSITSVEAVALGVMAAIVVAVAVPSYLTMRDRGHDTTARDQVRRAAEAVEEYRAANGSLARITPASLRRYDEGLAASAYRLQVNGRSAYCVESTAGGREWHIAGPAGAISRGSCPSS